MSGAETSYALAKDFSVYAPDTLGHGFHGFPATTNPDRRSPRWWNIWVISVDYLGVDSFAAIGSSFGALIAALLYFRFPDRVAKLVLEAAAPL